MERTKPFVFPRPIECNCDVIASGDDDTPDHRAENLPVITHICI